MSSPNNKSPNGRRVTGTVKRHPDGYGFLIPDERGIPDLYIPKHFMEGVMTNDRLSAQVKPDGQRFRGEAIKVVSRETKQVIGRINTTDKSRGFLKDESLGWGENLKVIWSQDKKVKDGDFALVKITTYPDSIRGFQGEVEVVLGDIEDPQNDNFRILTAHHIPYQFSAEAIRQADTLPKTVTSEDKQGRKDLCKLPFITIDGKTAKDFDDAILVQREDGGFRLWVAIADVSHYVKPDSPIDKDAFQRGTSTYFPNFVAPMLPEALSNELCSLKPNVERLALVAEMHMNFEGHCKNSKFYEAVILSHARVTYGEAQEVLEGQSVKGLTHVEEQIRLAADLAKILMKKRFAEGSLNLEIPETTIELDETGAPVDIIRSERLFAHRLIEELMLAANVAVARAFADRKMAALYRVHEEPKLEAIEMLEQYLMNFGYRKHIQGKGLQKKITEALEKFAGQPQETILNILALRSMNQAKYSEENVGHFGLGFGFYTHFTSPIRRYPDLIVHRLIKSTLYSNKGYRPMKGPDIESAGVFLSACEQRSVKAERQIQAIKKARFLKKYLGQEFDGVISSVTKFGLFVLLKKFDIDGLIRMEDLGMDHFDFDEDLLQLVGRNSDMQYQLGDMIKVQVAAADIQSGRIDFVLATGDESSHGIAKAKSQSSEKRGQAENDRGRVREARFPRSGGKNKARQGRARKASSRRHK